MSLRRTRAIAVGAGVRARSRAAAFLLQRPLHHLHQSSSPVRDWLAEADLRPQPGAGLPDTPHLSRPAAQIADSRGSIRRSEEHTSELQSPDHLVCRLLLEKKKNTH